MNVNSDDPLRLVRQSTSLGDLRNLTDETGPFLTIALNSPSHHEDASARLDARWRTARHSIPDDWPDELIEALDQRMDGLAHDAGEGVVVIQATSGAVLVEPTIEPLPPVVVHADPLPRLAAIIENRQRTLPHIVVVTDRAGADIVGFDGGTVTEVVNVEGTTLHIHRGHPGGWSQRRFQQRAENVWEKNADEVVSAVARLADAVDPVLVAVAGDVRAKSLVVEALGSSLASEVVELDAGDTDGISDEVVRHVSDRVARAQRAAAEQLREGMSAGAAVSFEGIVPALVEGRVSTLLVNDDDSDEPRLAGAPLGGPEGARTVDATIRAALRTDAGIVVMPTIAAMGGPVAGLLRW